MTWKYWERKTGNIKGSTQPHYYDAHDAIIGGYVEGIIQKQKWWNNMDMINTLISWSISRRLCIVKTKSSKTVVAPKDTFALIMSQYPMW